MRHTSINLLHRSITVWWEVPLLCGQDGFHKSDPLYYTDQVSSNIRHDSRCEVSLFVRGPIIVRSAIIVRGVIIMRGLIIVRGAPSSREVALTREVSVPALNRNTSSFSGGGGEHLKIDLWCYLWMKYREKSYQYPHDLQELPTNLYVDSTPFLYYRVYSSPGWNTRANSCSSPFFLLTFLAQGYSW